MPAGPCPPSVAAALGALAALVLLAGCVDDASPEPEPDSAFGSVVVELTDVVAMDRLSTGEIVTAGRLTGTVHRFSLAGPEPEVVAEVEVSSTGQRGLLGLVVDDRDRIFISWTDPDERFLIGRLPAPAGTDTSAVEIVWSGFASSTGANGGHLDILPDGRLVTGIGTLRRSSLIDDPDAVNGKILAFDPDGPPDQTPEVLSSGWKNPFAFTVTAGGELWVADNEPEDGSPERLARGDSNGGPVTDIDRQFAPSAVVQLGPDRLGVCSYIGGGLHPVDLDDGRASQPGSAIADGCRTAALVVDEDLLLLSDQDRLILTAIE